MGSPTSTPSSGHRFSGQREEFPLSEFYVLAQSLLPPLRPWGCSFGREACLWQSQKRKKEADFPYLSCPPSTTETRKRRFLSWSSFCLCPGCSSVVCTAVGPSGKVWKEKQKTEKSGNPDCLYFEFWFSSPIYLLPFTFQSSQTAAPCILSRDFSLI